MDIARIVDGVVVNLEVADLEWIEANADPEGGTMFVPYEADNPAVIGLGWDPIGGFEREPAEPETYKLTADELTVLGVDLTHADALVADKLTADKLTAPYGDDNPAHIGDSWSPIGGFTEQLETEPEPV